LTEVVASEDRLQSVRVPGFFWHGTKAVSDKPTLAVYCVNRLYDLQNPDEERRDWNDGTIADPRTGKPYDWNKPPHK
jgi:dTDP-4-dehydrorhamnose 3,5-epimerase